MILSNATIAWVVGAALSIGGTFGVNYAQIQVNASDIENTEKQYEYIQGQLSEIQKFLRDQDKHEHSEENHD